MSLSRTFLLGFNELFQKCIEKADGLLAQVIFLIVHAIKKEKKTTLKVCHHVCDITVGRDLTDANRMQRKSYSLGYHFLCTTNKNIFTQEFKRQ